MNNFQHFFSSRFCRRGLLLAVTFLIMLHTYWGEKIPLKAGAGWDGVQYRELVLHFDRMYLNGEVDAYHMHRILPFALSHGVLRCTGLPFTAENAMLVTVVVNQVVLLLTMLVFFRISSLRRWSVATELIGFAAAFWNVAVLKVFGYYPFLTDELALLLSFLAAYHYFSRQYGWLLVDGLLAMITWPALSLVVWLLLVFPQKASAEQASDFSVGRWLRWAGVICFPPIFLAFIYYKVRVHEGISFADMFTLRPPLNIWWTLLAVAVVPVFYWFALKPLQSLRLSLSGKSLLRICVGALIFILLYQLTAYGSMNTGFTPAKELAQMAQLPASDVLIFLETPFIYWGPFALLLIWNWPTICRKTLKEESTGLVLVLFFFLFFLLDIETRKHVMFFPFLLVLLMDVVKQQSWSSKGMWLFVGTSLLMAAWWYPWNVEGMFEALNSNQVAQYLQFPAQRYFMFQGLAQSREVYAVALIVEMLVLFAGWKIYKRS